MKQIKSEDPVPYTAGKSGDADDQIIARALEILAARVNNGRPLTSPAQSAKYLKIKLAGMEREVFGLILPDNRNRVISVVDLFYGTIDSASVHPREVVKAVLQANAAAVILYHNHPSGNAEPSAEDRALTRRLVDALALIDVPVLDHIVVGGAEHVSLAESGLM